MNKQMNNRIHQPTYEWVGGICLLLACLYLDLLLTTYIFSFIQSCLYKYTWLTSKNIAGKQYDSSSSPYTDSSNLEDQWTLLLKDAEYSSYSVLALSPCHKIIAFGNLKGKIKLQDISE